MTTLDDRLARLTSARRSAVAAAWGLPESENLAAALADPIVLKRRLARCSDRQLAVVAVLDRSDHPLSARQIADRLDVSVADLTPDLRALGDLLLIRRARLPGQPAAQDEAKDPADLPIELQPEPRLVVHQVVARRADRLPPGRRTSRNAAGGSALAAEVERCGGRAPVEDLIARLGSAEFRRDYFAGITGGTLEEVFTGGHWWLLAPESAAGPDGSRRDEGTALAWDLLVVVETIDRAGLELGHAEWSIRPDHHERLIKHLRGSSVQPEVRLSWLVRLAVGLGLAEPIGRTLSPTDAVAAWSSLDWPAQIRRLVAVWRDDLAWAEPTAPGRWGAVLDRPQLRARLLDRLARLPGDAPIRLADLAREVAAGWGAGLPGRLPDLSAAKAQALVRTLIELPVAWLGLIAIAGPSGSETVEVTPLGRSVLEPGAAPPPAAEPSVIVQGDLEILCLDSPPAALAPVLRATELSDPGAVSLHRLTRDTFWSAIDRGESPAGFLGALAPHLRRPVPDAVAEILGEWSAAYRAISVHPATLIAFDPPAALDALPADSPLAAYLDRRLGNGLAILRAGADSAAFLAAARAAGFRVRPGHRPAAL